MKLVGYQQSTCLYVKMELVVGTYSISLSCEFRGAGFIHVESAKLCMEMVSRLTCAVLWKVAWLAQNIQHNGTRV